MNQNDCGLVHLSRLSMLHLRLRWMMQKINDNLILFQAITWQVRKKTKEGVCISLLFFNKIHYWTLFVFYKKEIDIKWHVQDFQMNRICHILADMPICWHNASNIPLYAPTCLRTDSTRNPPVEVSYCSLLLKTLYAHMAIRKVVNIIHSYQSRTVWA